MKKTSLLIAFIGLIKYSECKNINKFNNPNEDSIKFNVKLSKQEIFILNDTLTIEITNYSQDSLKVISSSLYYKFFNKDTLGQI